MQPLLSGEMVGTSMDVPGTFHGKETSEDEGWTIFKKAAADKFEPKNKLNLPGHLKQFL